MHNAASRKKPAAAFGARAEANLFMKSELGTVLQRHHDRFIQFHAVGTTFGAI